MLDCGNASGVDQRDVDRADRSHQILSDDLFDVHRPRNGDEKEKKRECKIGEPWPAADEKYEADRNCDRDKRERPAQ